MTEAEFRAIALGMPGALEGEHMGHADFRVGGKIFATLGYPEDGWGMVKLSLEEQGEFVAEAPGVFAPCAGAWGRGGATSVKLSAAGKGVVKRAMAAAWRGVEGKQGKKKQGREK